MSRVYVGHLPHRCSDNDVRRFFKGYGRLREVVLKNGYGFVEFDNPKDAEDAVNDLHGCELRGERIIVEHARLPPGTRGGSRRSGPRDRRYGPPTRTEYRVIVENLSSRVSWQDLKDLMRDAGEVTYADAHKSAKNDGIVEFAAYGDMKEAIEKFDGYELYGRRLRVYEDRPNAHSRSGSRNRSRSDSRTRRRSNRSRSRDSHRRQKSRSPRRRHSGSSERRRSDSRDRRDSYKHSREGSAGDRSRSVSHRSVSHHSRDRSQSLHSEKRSGGLVSRSPSRNGNGVKDGSVRRSRSASRSRSRSRSRSVESHSPDRSRSRTHSHSRSRSRSRSVSNIRRSGSGRHSDEEMIDGRRSHDGSERQGSDE